MSLSSAERSNTCIPAGLGILVLCFFFGSQTSCDNPGSEKTDSLSIVVSIPPQADLVERIGGPDVRVLSLLKAGDSPHAYQPSDYQVSQVLHARVYFQIGIPFEQGKWASALRNSGQDIHIVDLREGVPMRSISHPFHEEGGACCSEHEEGHAEGRDPHIWLAPDLLAIQARTIAEALERIDPPNSRLYQDNLNSLLAELETVDKEIKVILQVCRGKRLYVYHPAWGYFCDAYGLEQVPVEIEGKEPSDEELTRFQREFSVDGVRAIFVQPQIAGASARAVSNALGVPLKTLDPLEENLLENLRKVAKSIADSYE